MPNESHDFYFGPSAAANDHDLLKYFVNTKIFNIVRDVSDRRCVIVGRKGSGKTAIFKCLQERDDETTLVVPVSPETHQIFEVQSRYTHRQYQNLFEYELLLEALKALYRSSKKHVALAKTHLEQFAKALGRKLKDLNNIQILGSGAATGDARVAAKLGSVQQSDALWNVSVRAPTSGLG